VSNYFNWTMTDINANPVTSTVTTYSTTAITDYAIEFLNNHRATRPTDPWFMYVPYNAPHGTGASTGFQVPPANLHSVDVGGLAPGAISDTIPVYQAMVEALDTEIGRLLNAVGAIGTPERDNTIIIFMGDNGTPAAVKDSSANIRGSKSDIYEGGVRVPLVIAGAGVGRQNERDSKLVAGADLFPTIASLAGIQNPTTNDGKNLVPLLSNTSASTGRTSSFSEMCLGTTSRLAGVRGDRYKLLSINGTWSLFDLQADPKEQTNRYNDAPLLSEQAVLQNAFADVKLDATTGCLP
jgi:arylsulfatase A-like enzyme